MLNITHYQRNANQPQWGTITRQSGWLLSKSYLLNTFKKELVKTSVVKKTLVDTFVAKIDSVGIF